MSRLEGGWVIIGAGRVGRALALSALGLGLRIEASWNRSAESAARTAALCPGIGRAAHGALDGLAAELGRSRSIWLAVRDDAIAPVARRIAPHLCAGARLYHLSGALSASALGRPDGVERASVHPAWSVADPRRAAASWSGAIWTLEGDDGAVAEARAFVEALGARATRIEASSKPLYHAGASIAAGGVVAALDLAIEAARGAGLSEGEARRMTTSLAASALSNLSHRGVYGALTGPAARGDRGVIEAHCRALGTLGRDALSLYEALGARAQTIAQRGREEE